MKIEFLGFKMRSPGYKAVLRSSEVQADLERRAQDVAKRAKEMYDAGDGIREVNADSYRGKGRAGATVIALGPEVGIVEAERRVLGNSINAAR